jgi:hypothetical protein
MFALALISHLKTFPLMFKLFTMLKARPSDEPVTQEEIRIAQGKEVLNPAKARAWFDKLEAASENVRHAFERQAEAAAVRLQSFTHLEPIIDRSMFQGPWDQEKLEQLIAEWIVACDQPFDEVDKPEFRAMLTYAHHPSPTLKIPHRDAIKRRIMRMGEDSIEDTKRMFEVLHLSNLKYAFRVT